MSIKILPQEVASKIAAGEVVERPVSVVKELIENSIDAGATQININVQEAGKKIIEVIDNGIGIPFTESHVALMRYATSKLTTISDLDTIQTLGFRGEALASIAAVSAFKISSRIAGEEAGFFSRIEGGVEQDKREIGRPVGTQITVENLFFNVPARLKFLKSNRTEKRLINTLIMRYALCYSDIRFTLTQDQRKVIQTSGNGDRREILTSIYGLETAKSLLEVDAPSSELKLNGFTSPLSISRASRRELFFFVNGRLIVNSTLSSAVVRAYHGLLMVGRYPITSLFIGIAPKEIDVNVHPTKAEIRLRNSDAIFSFIHSAIRKTISAYAPFAVVSPSIWTGNAQAKPESPGLLHPVEDKTEDGIVSPESAGQQELLPIRKAELPLLRLIGQLGTTYIAAEGPDGLYLIDQHAAHERILYEQLTTGKMNQNASQFLLEPVIINLSNPEHQLLMEYYDLLTNLGFRMEPFGPRDYKLTAIPSVLTGADPHAAVLSAITDDEQDSAHSNMELSGEERIISRICKRLAVKGGQTLSHDEQLQLLRDLESCTHPRTCPHGRPTMIHISVDALERRFGRRGSV